MEEEIDAYVNGKLEQPALAAFEAALATDPDLQEEVAFRKELKIAATLHAREYARQALRRAQMAEKQVFYYKIAASVALLAVAAWAFLFFINQQNDTAQLFAEFYQPYPNIELPTVRGDADQDPRKKAFEAYDRDDFQEAGQLFSALYKSTGDPVNAFYLGVSYMELQNFEGAMESFSQVNNQEANYFWEARWYTALCLLQTGRPEAAKQTLQQIQASGHFLEKKAGELLLRLP